MFFSDIKAEDILSAMNGMKINEIAGCGEFYLSIVKEAKNEMDKPLTAIFNKSLAMGKSSR